MDLRGFLVVVKRIACDGKNLWNGIVVVAGKPCITGVLDGCAQYCKIY
jgi:hypothetical protein